MGTAVTCLPIGSILSLYLRTSHTMGKNCLGDWKSGMGLEENSGRKNQARHGVLPGKAGEEGRSVLVSP